MAFSLFPSFVRIFYHSSFAPHIMTIPTLQWSPSASPEGEFDTHNAGVVDAQTMVEELVNTFAAIYTAAVTFDNYIIFNYPDEDSDPVPVASGLLGIDGADASTAWIKAVQQTFTFRTTLGNIAKLTLLDAPTNNNFDRVTVLSGDYATMALAFFDEDNGWAGRDGGRPSVFIQASATLNEKLRRQYHMQ